MDYRKLLQPALAFFGQFHQNSPAVAFVATPAQEFKFCHSIHKFDGCVVSNEKELRKITDRNRVWAGKPSDREQSLVLLRCQAGLVGGRLAEGLKFP
jgi:hypothetical protein